jgi:thioredoxin 1
MLDIDQVEEVSKELDIRSVPTLLLFKDGKKVGEVNGGLPKVWEEAIEKHYTKEKA